MTRGERLSLGIKFCLIAASISSILHASEYSPASASLDSGATSAKAARGAGPAESTTLKGRAMGTIWSVAVRPTRNFDAAAAERAISARLEALEQQFSTYRTRSVISQFNALGHTEWFAVSAEMISVATEARRISELTGGAFDVTVAPLLRVWGFGPQRRAGDLPDASAVQTARALVDWRALEVQENPPALRKRHAKLEIDLSSLAKGFAADAISELLTAAGATDHLVQIGGDTRAGPSNSQVGWQVGVESADLLNTLPAAVVRLNGQALSTSGDYRNFFIVAGKRYGHILDPRTGQPASGSLASVSVIHPACATSSALATALFVLGADHAYSFATTHNLACLFQVRDGANLTHRFTPAFAALVQRP